jgi:tetratricopeptide (TPR) repeat protein
MSSLVLALLVAAAPATADYGELDFPVTGNAECRRLFALGALQLHSFEYGDAHATFQEAVKADPGCAMARWGDAMAYSHPIWGEDQVESGRAALAPIKDEKGLTDRERAHLRAARALYGTGDVTERLAAWLRETERNHHAFPGDDELALQHALALIANSDRYANVGRTMEAAAITMDVFQRKPKHPGAAHYLIHACDTPDHAILALPAARAYAKIAPAAPHARHMPSHIFVQLGMWTDSVASNEDAWAASARRGGDSHSYSWLGASYLELGQFKKAEAVLLDMQKRLLAHDSVFMRFDYGNLTRKFLNDTGRWAEAVKRYEPMSRPLLEQGDPGDSLGCSMHAPATGGNNVRAPFGLIARARMQAGLAEGALHSGDEPALRKNLDALQQTVGAMKPWTRMLPPDLADRTERQRTAFLAAAKAFREKSPAAWNAALEAASRWADSQERVGPQGPAFDPPARILLGDVALAAGKPKEAAAAYDGALARNPNLSRALLGAARAAEKAGDPETARERYGTLAAQWKAADPDVPALDEVRRGAAPARTTQR